MSGRRSAGGYSLLELLIAVALMAFVTSQTLLAFSAQHENYTTQERVVETQQDMRLLTDWILQDLRMAGFMVPRQTAVGSVDGGAGAPDVVCASDPAAFVSSSYANATDRFDAATVTGSVAAGALSVNLTASEMDIDSDGANDFVANEGILLSDGTNLHCGRITNVAGGSVDFTPATAFTLPATSTKAVPAVVYQVVGNTLTRNATVLSNQVDDLQMEFWVDTDGDGAIGGGEFPIDDLNGLDVTRARLARVHLTTHTAAGDPDFTGQRAAAANRAGAVGTDTLRRRKATADARLRNME